MDRGQYRVLVSEGDGLREGGGPGANSGLGSQESMEKGQ